MTKNLDDIGLKSVADHYDLFFVDLWGVVHNGIELYKESTNALEKLLEKNNPKVQILTLKMLIEVLKQPI